MIEYGDGYGMILKNGYGYRYYSICLVPAPSSSLFVSAIESSDNP